MTIHKRNCDFCGEYYEGQGANFCSHSCSVKYRHKDRIKDPYASKKYKRNCDRCGEPYHGFGKYYCSDLCRTGGDGTNKSFYKRNCDVCGKYYEGTSAHFCSWDCKLSLKATQNRLLKKVVYENDGCWTSTFKNRSIKHNKKDMSIFKIAYSLKHEIDLENEIAYVHSCNNTMCINPDHLFPTTEQGRSKQQLMDDDERFWLYVEIKDFFDCWEWTGTRHPEKKKGIGNYGKFSLNGKAIPSHRYSYELHYGEIPAGMIICHHCDNPPCVNPNHLFLGTSSDNRIDMINKGRGNFFKKYDEELIEILKNEIGDKKKHGLTRDEKSGRFIADGKTYREVGEKYNLTPSLVWQLLHQRKTHQKS